MFTLETIVPWGRSFDEYCRMFGLGGKDLVKTILGAGDGPAAFNAEATKQGSRVTSCDPIYQWSVSQLEERISATYDEVLEQTHANAEQFVWSDIASIEQLGAVRMGAMRTFLDDFERGKATGRYVAGALPRLPFDDNQFDLALCSHFLFLYAGHLDETFHRQAVRELMRVAIEVRIFPLLTLDGQLSDFVEPVVSDLRTGRHKVVLERVPYEFQRGGHTMMRISR